MAQSYRYRPALFFGVTLLVTWVPWVAAIALQTQPHGEAGVGSLLNLLGLLGPLIVSLAIVFGSANRPLRRDFLDRLVNLRRIRPAFLLLALVMPPIVIALSIWLSYPLGEPHDQLRLSTSDNLGGAILLTMVLAPIIEELGWRGYGVDSLRAYQPMLKASLLFGVLWSLWHVPLVWIRGTYHYELATMANPIFLVNFFVGVVPAAVIANWLYYKNDRSILVGILLHAMLNACGVLLSAGQVAKTIASLLYVVIAVALFRLDRATFVAGPRSFLPDDPAA